MPISKPVVTDYFVDIIPEMSKKLGILIETIQATTASCREVQRLVDTGNFGSNAGLLGEFTKSRVYHMNIIQSSTQIAHSDDSLIRGVTMALVAGTPLAGLLGDDPAEMIAEGLVGRMVAEDKLSVERARRKLELDQMMADGLQALSFNNAESSTSASRRRSTQPRTSRITSFWQFPTGDGKMARIADFVFAFI